MWLTVTVTPIDDELESLQIPSTYVMDSLFCKGFRVNFHLRGQTFMSEALSHVIVFVLLKMDHMCGSQPLGFSQTQGRMMPMWSTRCDTWIGPQRTLFVSSSLQLCHLSLRMSVATGSSSKAGTTHLVKVGSQFFKFPQETRV